MSEMKRPRIRWNIVQIVDRIYGRPSRTRRWFRGRAASGHLGIQFRKGDSGLEVQLIDMENVIPLGWCSLQEQPYFHGILKMELLPYHGLRDEADILDLMDALGAAPLSSSRIVLKSQDRQP